MSLGKPAPFYHQGSSQVIDYGTWLADDSEPSSLQPYMTSSEAATWARYNHHQLVEAEDVSRPLGEGLCPTCWKPRYRSIEDGTIMIEVTGERLAN